MNFKHPLWEKGREEGGGVKMRPGNSPNIFTQKRYGKCTEITT